MRALKAAARHPARVKGPAKKTVKKSVGKTAAVKSTASKAAATKATPAKARWVYGFGGGKAAGHPGMRDLLGGKGAGLAEMANLGLPVPPGFTITTEVCTHYYANGNSYPTDLERQVNAALAEVGRITGKNVRRQVQSAAGVGALGRARLDARHDGHGAQSRPQRRDRRGAGAGIRRPALRL